MRLNSVLPLMFLAFSERVDMIKCPGQDQRFWKPDDIFEINCKGCGKVVEFWKDESSQKCPSCGVKMWNPKVEMGCAEWCQYADQCVGDLLKDKKAAVLCDKLGAEMKACFGDDQKRIDHALKVLEYAERIHVVEGGDPLVIKAAAILHDIGIQAAERIHGSTAGNYQEIEGPPIAGEIMAKFDIPADSTEHICKIIANHHSAKDIDTLEFRIIWDADWLVNIPEVFENLSGDKLREKIDKIFKTAEGRKIAEELYFSGQN